MPVPAGCEGVRIVDDVCAAVAHPRGAAGRAGGRRQARRQRRRRRQPRRRALRRHRSRVDRHGDPRPARGDTGLVPGGSRSRWGRRGAHHRRGRVQSERPARHLPVRRRVGARHARAGAGWRDASDLHRLPVPRGSGVLAGPRGARARDRTVARRPRRRRQAERRLHGGGATSAGRWSLYALEINLRKGGTTHPVQRRCGTWCPGSTGPSSGRWLAVDGTSRCYVSTDNLVDPAGSVCRPADVIRAVADAGLQFDRRTDTGVVLHMLSCLAVDGRLGLDRDRPDHPTTRSTLYDETARTIADLARTGPAGPFSVSRADPASWKARR